jgi:hypothetical protein
VSVVARLINGEFVHQLHSEWEASLQLADETLRHSTEYGLQQYSTFAMGKRSAAIRVAASRYRRAYPL